MSGAPGARRLLICNVESRVGRDGLVFAPRLDCALYILDRGNTKKPCARCAFLLTQIYRVPLCLIIPCFQTLGYARPYQGRKINQTETPSVTTLNGEKSGSLRDYGCGHRTATENPRMNGAVAGCHSSQVKRSSRSLRPLSPIARRSCSVMSNNFINATALQRCSRLPATYGWQLVLRIRPASTLRRHQY